MLSNKFTPLNWMLISFTAILIFSISFLIVKSNTALSVFLLVSVSIITLYWILKKPYLGLAFMIGSIPLQIYTDLPGNISFSSITSLFGAITLVSFVIKLKHRSLDSKFNDIQIYIFAFLLLLLFLVGELYKPTSPEFRFPFTYFQLLVLLWLAAQLLTTQQKIETLMKIFIGANIVALLFTLQNFSFFLLAVDGKRFSGLSGNANEFAVYLSVAEIMLLYFYKTGKGKFSKFIILSLALFFIMPIFLSGSRGAALFLVLALVWMVWRWGKKDFWIIFLFIGFIILLSFFLPPEYIQRMQQIPADIINQSDTVGFRYSLWNYAIALWRQKPVFGIGPGMFYYYSIDFLGTKHLLTHNTYITFLTENGIVGLSLFLFIVFRSAQNYEKAIRQNVHNFSMKYLAISLEVIMLMLLMNATKQNLNSNKVLWIVFALSMVVTSLGKNSSQDLQELETLS